MYVYVIFVTKNTCGASHIYFALDLEDQGNFTKESMCRIYMLLVSCRWRRLLSVLVPERQK